MTWADDDDALFETVPQRPFSEGDRVIVDTILGLKSATVEWAGQLNGFPAVRVNSGGGIYTVGAARVRHATEEDQ